MEINFIGKNHFWLFFNTIQRADTKDGHGATKFRVLFVPPVKVLSYFIVSEEIVSLCPRTNERVNKLGASLQPTANREYKNVTIIYSIPKYGKEIQ